MSGLLAEQALSEAIQSHLNGRKVSAAVFVTFRFEPDFFELEVLPVLLNTPLSHVEAVRLYQLEDILRDGTIDVAVYYDRGALLPGERSARLDVRRIPCRTRTGYFHPKILLAMSEPEDPESGELAQLLVAVLSANVTRAGWWENVEVGHIEVLNDGDRCSFKDDLRWLLRRVRDSAPPEADHTALERVRSFVRGLEQRHSTTRGVLHTQLFSGRTSLLEWLADLLPAEFDQLRMEVISPYFDESEAKPLRSLCEHFAPQEVRVYLPETDAGGALCRQGYYDAVASIRSVKWGTLPATLLSRGKGERQKSRFVHAKVYRFFDQSGYEAILVGSVNLTGAAHNRGGNLEAAFLVEQRHSSRPGWWLTSLQNAPTLFVDPDASSEDQQLQARLSIRFDWKTERAEAHWDSPSPSPVLSVTAQGSLLFTIEAQAPGFWTPLPADASAKLRDILTSTSFLLIREDAGEYTILVEETGMAVKPSVMLELTVADILKSWSLFTSEQRSAFIEEKGSLLEEALRELGVDPKKILGHADSFFDLHAGIFLAFANLERQLMKAVSEKRDREIEYRLLGKKYDSMITLLERARSDAERTGDNVAWYLMILCAQQLVDRIVPRDSEFRQRFRDAFADLERELDALSMVRDSFVFDTETERAAFFDWFEDWFLARAEPLEVEA